MFKLFCWVWGIALGLWAIAVFAPSSPSNSQQARTTERPGTAERKVVMTDSLWSRGGFGVVMLLDFTIRNDHDYAVKDIAIRCDHFGPSGTKIDDNRRIVYERIPAHSSLSKPEFNMGWFHSQTSRSSCYVVRYARG